MEWDQTIYTLCSHICHQKPDRSLYIAGVQFPLCARCTGIYASMIFALIVIPVEEKIRYRTLYSALTMAVLVNCITFIPGYDSATVRFIVGSALGTVLGFIIKKAIKTIIIKEGQ